MGCHHLTEGERYQIEALSKAKKSPTYIAQQLGRSKSTISRELARNNGRRVYRAVDAQQRYRQQLIDKGCARQCWHLVFDEVAVPLQEEGWSPEQISGFYRRSDYAVSHEWLYQRILATSRTAAQPTGIYAARNNARSVMASQNDAVRLLTNARLQSGRQKLKYGNGLATGKLTRSSGPSTKVRLSAWSNARVVTRG